VEDFVSKSGRFCSTFSKSGEKVEKIETKIINKNKSTILNNHVARYYARSNE
jgi:hypothetical protein